MTNISSELQNNSQILLYKACKASNVEECKRLLQIGECVPDRISLNIVVKNLGNNQGSTLNKNNKEIYKLFTLLIGDSSVEYETLSPSISPVNNCKYCNFL